MGSLKLKCLQINLATRGVVYNKLQKAICTHKADVVLMQKVGDKDSSQVKEDLQLARCSSYRNTDSKCIEVLSGFKNNSHLTVMSVETGDEICFKITTKVLKSVCETLVIVNIYWPNISQGHIQDMLNTILTSSNMNKTAIAIGLDNDNVIFDNVREYAHEKELVFNYPSDNRNNIVLFTSDLSITYWDQFTIKETPAMIFEIEVKRKSFNCMGKSLH